VWGFYFNHVNFGHIQVFYRLHVANLLFLNYIRGGQSAASKLHPREMTRNEQMINCFLRTRKDTLCISCPTHIGLSVQPYVQSLLHTLIISSRSVESSRVLDHFIKQAKGINFDANNLSWIWSILMQLFVFNMLTIIYAAYLIHTYTDL
jgi:hypothetical protein